MSVKIELLFKTNSVIRLCIYDNFITLSVSLGENHIIWSGIKVSEILEFKSGFKEHCMKV